MSSLPATAGCAYVGGVIECNVHWATRGSKSGHKLSVLILPTIFYTCAKKQNHADADSDIIATTIIDSVALRLERVTTLDYQ